MLISVFKIRAGTPPTMDLGGTSAITTALGAMTDPAPIVMGPMMRAPAPMKTRSPMFGTTLWCERPPMVIPCPMVTSRPITVSL